MVTEKEIKQAKRFAKLFPQIMDKPLKTRQLTEDDRRRRAIRAAKLHASIFGYSHKKAESAGIDYAFLFRNLPTLSKLAI